MIWGISEHVAYGIIWLSNVKSFYSVFEWSNQPKSLSNSMEISNSK